MNISPIQPSSIQPIVTPLEIGDAANASGGSDFQSVLQGAIDQVQYHIKQEPAAPKRVDGVDRLEQWTFLNVL